MNSLIKPKSKILWILLICLFTPLISFQQTTSGNKIASRNLRYHIEDLYRLDDLLVNGILYHPENSNAKGSPYFLNDKLWKNSTIFIKGRRFPNQKILYNIVTDEIITNVVYSDGRVRNIIINSQFIDSILIENRFFVNTSVYSTENTDGLLEKVYKGNFTALIKHQKSFHSTLNYDTPNGYFSPPTATLFIISDNSLLKIGNKKALLGFFKSEKKKIAKYIRSNNIKLKTGNVIELFNLFKYCDEPTNKKI